MFVGIVNVNVPEDDETVPPKDNTAIALLDTLELYIIAPDAEIVEIDEKIEQEIADGTIPDPAMLDPITGEPLPPEGGMMEAPPLDTGITNGQVDKDTKTAEI